MLRRFVAIVAMAVIAATAAFVAPASAAKPVGGSFTTTLDVPPTTVTVDDYTITVSGSLTATVTQFKVDSNGHLIAVATVSGTLTATEPTLGTATITITNLRVVLNAHVTADCAGHLKVDFTGAVQVDATIVFTDLNGASTTIDLHKTVPLHGTLTYTATTQQQQSLICDIATLLGNRSSVNALVDKLNTLLKQL
jgi:hypothetical protein